MVEIRIEFQQDKGEGAMTDPGPSIVNDVRYVLIVVGISVPIGVVSLWMHG
jgi:hypothetical protein